MAHGMGWEAVLCFGGGSWLVWEEQAQVRMARERMEGVVWAGVGGNVREV